MRVVLQEMRLHPAEAPRERQQLLLRQVLIANADHPALVERGLDLRELGIIDAIQIDGGDVRADDIGSVGDLHRGLKK
ncbi:hypothetical protein D3C83_130480 [compost metagenome]